MSLTSQIITAEFPDLDKVEALNREAFPEEERVPISEFLHYTNAIPMMNGLISLPSTMRKNLLVLLLQFITKKCSTLASLRLCRTFAAMAMGEKLFIN